MAILNDAAQLIQAFELAMNIGTVLGFLAGVAVSSMVYLSTKKDD
jgi:hypothetical protein